MMTASPLRTVNDTPMPALAEQHCTPRRGPDDRLPAAEVATLLEELPEWRIAADGLIEREYRFPDFAAAMAFAQRVAAMAEAENHHPELIIGYGRCTVRYHTHDVGGLSLNDLICAARADQLYS
jgi:4a-hydroxytetrahydrobiopterin dehydratase